MDEDVNRRISSVLQIGMSVSIIIIIIGLVMYILLPASYDEITMSLGEIASGILTGNPIAVINLGIILLIATPLARVAALTATFISKKEMKFVLACAAVLILVAATIAINAGA